MQTSVTSKITQALEASFNEPQTTSEHSLRTLTTEEILVVSGGPEVDIETGGS